MSQSKQPFWLFVFIFNQKTKTKWFKRKQEREREENERQNDILNDRNRWVTLRISFSSHACRQLIFWSTSSFSLHMHVYLFIRQFDACFIFSHGFFFFAFYTLPFISVRSHSPVYWLCALYFVTCLSSTFGERWLFVRFKPSLLYLLSYEQRHAYKLTNLPRYAHKNLWKFIESIHSHRQTKHTHSVNR